MYERGNQKVILGFCNIFIEFIIYLL